MKNYYLNHIDKIVNATYGINDAHHRLKDNLIKSYPSREKGKSCEVSYAEVEEATGGYVIRKRHCGFYDGRNTFSKIKY